MEFKQSNIPKKYRSKYKVNTSVVSSAGGSSAGVTPTYTDKVQFITNSVLEFPNLGEPNVLYIAKDEATEEQEIYIFNTTTMSYQKITNNYDRINTIIGGTA